MSHDYGWLSYAVSRRSHCNLMLVMVGYVMVMLTCNEIAIVHVHNLIIYLKASVETTYSGKLLFLRICKVSLSITYSQTFHQGSIEIH